MVRRVTTRAGRPRRRAPLVEAVCLAITECLDIAMGDMTLLYTRVTQILGYPPNPESVCRTWRRYRKEGRDYWKRRLKNGV